MLQPGRNMSEEDTKKVREGVDACLSWIIHNPSAGKDRVNERRDAFKRATEILSIRYYRCGDCYACTCGWRVADEEIMDGRYTAEKYRGIAKMRSRAEKHWVPEAGGLQRHMKQGPSFRRDGHRVPAKTARRNLGRSTSTLAKRSISSARTISTTLTATSPWPSEKETAATSGAGDAEEFTPLRWQDASSAPLRPPMEDRPCRSSPRR